MGLEPVFENERCSKQEQNSKETTLASIGSAGLPARKGQRPQTIRGPLHIQCNGHGDSKYLNQLVGQVLKLALHRVTYSVCWPAEYNSNAVVRDGGQRRTFGFLNCQGVWTSTLGSSDDLSSFATGMRSLGDRPRMGRAALPCIF